MKLKNLISPLVAGLLVVGSVALATVNNPAAPAGVQTPWVGNVNGGGYTLTNVSGLTSTGNIVAGGSATSTITGDGTQSIFGTEVALSGGSGIVLEASMGIGWGNVLSVTDRLAIDNAVATNTLSIYPVGTGGEIDLDFSAPTDIRTFTFPDQSGTFAISSTVMPTASSTPCVVGEWRATSTYIYACVSVNQWTRSTSTINW